MAAGSGIVSLLSSPPKASQPPTQYGWRPPQWTRPAKVSITVPAQPTTAYTGQVTSGSSSGSSFTIESTTVMSSPLTYVFDAVLALDHAQTLTKTRHPVQTGAAVNTHAYIEPATLVLDVLMSDAAQGYVAASQNVAPYYQIWPGSTSGSVGNAASRSRSAYQTMLNLQALRIPLTVTTKLRTYSNMLIASIAPREDYKTVTGLRMRVEFEQLFLTSILVISARPNDTASNGLGTVSPQTPSSTVIGSGNGTTNTGSFGVNPGSGVTPQPFPPSQGPPPAPQGFVDGDSGVAYYTTQGSDGSYSAAPGTPNPMPNGSTWTAAYPNTVGTVDVPGAGTASSYPTTASSPVPPVT